MWAVKHFRHYLYGYRCIVFTDHEALKSLLNTPQPSGKLARWGMALQELDLRIEYRPGKSNVRADALSRYPVSLLPRDYLETVAPTLVAAMETPHTLFESGEGSRDLTLRERQCKDTHLKPMIDYLETGNLPQDEKQAREFVLSKELFTMRTMSCIVWNVTSHYGSYRHPVTGGSSLMKPTVGSSQDTYEKPRSTVS